MKDVQKIKEFFLKDRAMTSLYEETAVDMAKKKLDALGVKYEMSATDKVRPFKVIHKPINKSDEFYDKFNNIVDLFNLKGVVKTSMSEAQSLTGGYPHKKTSGAGFEKIEITEPMDDATKSRMIKNFRAAGWDAKPNNGGGITAVKKSIMEAKSSISDYKVGDILKFKDGEDWKVMKIKDNVGKLVIKPHNEKAKKGNVSLEIDIDLDYLKKNLTEAKKEDAVDTITMDIPLFLRMLEYSREDASQDMDLHDVTEKANTLGKERGILSMDDYEEIVGAAKEIDEAELNEVNLKKGDVIKFANGEKWFIIGPKGAGYDFKTNDNQTSWAIKGWFDMMISSGKATVNEETLSEAYVPSNIKEFAKRKGVSSLVNKVAGSNNKLETIGREALKAAPIPGPVGSGLQVELLPTQAQENRGNASAPSRSRGIPSRSRSR